LPKPKKIAKARNIAKAKIIDEDILPEGDYKWRCKICGKKGGYNCDGVEDPKIIADAIYRSHQEVSPGCQAINVEVFDREMRLQEELMEFVKLELVKNK
jgi:hypothetical protein